MQEAKEHDINEDIIDFLESSYFSPEEDFENLHSSKHGLSNYQKKHVAYQYALYSALSDKNVYDQILNEQNLSNSSRDKQQVRPRNPSPTKQVGKSPSSLLQPRGTEPSAPPAKLLCKDPSDASPKKTSQSSTEVLESRSRSKSPAKSLSKHPSASSTDQSSQSSLGLQESLPRTTSPRQPRTTSPAKSLTKHPSAPSSKQPSQSSLELKVVLPRAASPLKSSLKSSAASSYRTTCASPPPSLPQSTKSPPNHLQLTKSIKKSKSVESNMSRKTSNMSDRTLNSNSSSQIRMLEKCPHEESPPPSCFSRYCCFCCCDSCAGGPSSSTSSCYCCCICFECCIAACCI
jgi:hypothetical protein